MLPQRFRKCDVVTVVEVAGVAMATVGEAAVVVGASSDGSG